eukprot:739359-Pyramimonas_sp.AAC.1
MKRFTKQWGDKVRLTHARAKPPTAPDAGMVGDDGLIAGDPQGMLETFREQLGEIWTERVDSSADFPD